MKTSLTDSSALEHYGHNLTHVARQGTLPPLDGYEAVVARAFQILLRQEKSRNKYNPLLLDIDETRRWRVVLEVVRRMAAGEAPDPLPSRDVIALDYEALFARSSDSEGSCTFVTPEHPLFDESECHASNKALARLQALFLAVRQAEGRILLFVNHFHWLVGGGPHGYSLDISNLLVPALARREVQLIGACTLAEYRQYIERDAAIQRRFQEFNVKSDKEL